MCAAALRVHLGVMNRYIIERNIRGAGRLSAEELSSIARKSVDVLESMDQRIQWNESFITGDRLSARTAPTVRTPFASTGGAAGSPSMASTR
jgi:Protein of unknown function (DUF4242)